MAHNDLLLLAFFSPLVTRTSGIFRSPIRRFTLTAHRPLLQVTPRIAASVSTTTPSGAQRFGGILGLPTTMLYDVTEYCAKKSSALSTPMFSNPK
jgi:hypothetical protein